MIAPLALEVPARYEALVKDAARVAVIQLCVHILAAASGEASDTGAFLSTLAFIVVGVVVYHLVVESAVVVVDPALGPRGEGGSAACAPDGARRAG
jgi:hypothetical protein